MTESTGDTGALLGLSTDLADAVGRAGRSVVAINGRHHTPSSGIHWKQGAIVTAGHTIEREGAIPITLPDGSTVQATPAGADSSTDLAVLRLENASLPVADIGDSSTLKVGHLALAVARPGEIGLSATLGAISALGGAWRTWSGGQIDSFIRPDLTLYPGFSGGPLVSAAGQVVGLNTSGLSRSMPLAIPTNTVNRVVEQLLSKGRVARGYLGVGLQPVRLPDSLVKSAGISGDVGLIVVSVESGSPAEKAGLYVGDVLVSLNGKRVEDPRDVQSTLGPDSVGKAVSAQILRGGKVEQVNLTVAERPQKGA
jgi:S1-C subfamily serine protease